MALARKNIFIGLLMFVVGVVSLFGFGQALAQEDTTIHFFWSSGCPHCSDAKTFLKELQDRFPEIEVRQYEFAKNIELVKKYYQDYNVPAQEQGYVPAIFTPDNYFVGFNQAIGSEIERCVRECMAGEEKKEIEPEVKVPFLGNIKIEDFSLPALAIILGTLDGFNICSLGALVLILTLVLALKSKKKILLFGSIFVVTTVAVYALLVMLWHQLFVFLSPYIKKMEIIIAILAFGGGLYFLNELFKSLKKINVCKFGGISEKLLRRIEKVFENKGGFFALALSVLLFAVAVTIIEFPCTAFFPALFTGILAKAEIPLASSIFYILIYALFYMLDEIIILLIAFFTMRIWITSSKSLAVINGIGSLLLFALGFYYLSGLF